MSLKNIYRTHTVSTQKWVLLIIHKMLLKALNAKITVKEKIQYNY